MFIKCFVTEINYPLFDSLEAAAAAPPVATAIVLHRCLGLVIIN